MITNTQSGTNIQEVADGIFRINTPVSIPGAGQFSFNQYLIVDDAPMLFHTGQRQLFPLVSRGHSRGDAAREAALPRSVALRSR